MDMAVKFLRTEVAYLLKPLMELQFLQFRWSTSLVSYATNGAQPSIFNW